MTSQPSLFPPSLPKRQAIVMALFNMNERIRPFFAGLVVHQTRGCSFCQDGKPCEYAEREGREVLNALKRKGLVKMDRHHVYRRVDSEVKTSQSGGYDPATSEIPF